MRFPNILNFRKFFYFPINNPRNTKYTVYDRFDRGYQMSKTISYYEMSKTVSYYHSE